MTCYCSKKDRKSAILRNRSKIGRDTLYEVLVLLTGRHIYAQIVNIASGKTICSVSTLKNGNNVNSRNTKNASIVGKELANKCLSMGIANVSFNRANNKFCGVLRCLAGEFYNGLK